MSRKHLADLIKRMALVGRSLHGQYSSGLPLKIPMEGNSYGKTGQFLPGATLIGDILEKQGYEQSIMFGADADLVG